MAEKKYNFDIPSCALNAGIVGTGGAGFPMHIKISAKAEIVIANGAECILLPEQHGYDEQAIIQDIVENRANGKKHYIIINAEGIGHSSSMAKRIEAATGMETRATILGHMQRGGSPSCKDRVYASTMGALAVDLLCEGKTNRVVGYQNGEFVDFDIDEALAMNKGISEYQYEICQNLGI